MAALDLTTAGINHGSAASLDDLTAFTFLILIRADATAQNCGLFGKGTAAGSNRRSLELRTSVTASAIFCIIDGATTDHTAESVTNAYAQDVWTWIAATWAGGDTAPKIFTGTLTSLLAEVSYSATNNGSGAPSSNAANDQLVGAFGGGTGVLNGRAAVAMIWNRELTLQELQAQQFRPHRTSGCVLYTRYGYDGTGTQRDFSGNGNTGTTSGASVVDGAPLPPPFGWDLGVPYAVSAAAPAAQGPALALMGVGW